MGGGEWSRVESSEVEADDVAGSVLASFPAIDLGRGGAWRHKMQSNKFNTPSILIGVLIEEAFDSDSLDCPCV